MTRIVKKPEERRKELIGAAIELFQVHGYASTTVESIIKKTGIAKGTFYHYYRSKEEILNDVVETLLENIVKDAKEISDNENMNALEKFKMLFTAQNPNKDEAQSMVEALHRPENRELHERINVETILQLSPIVADITNQGIKEGIFHLDHVLETAQLLLTATQFLTDSGLFHWSQDELITRFKATESILERALGAPKGSFSFLTKHINE